MQLLSGQVHNVDPTVMVREHLQLFEWRLTFCLISHFMMCTVKGQVAGVLLL